MLGGLWAEERAAELGVPDHFDKGGTRHGGVRAVVDAQLHGLKFYGVLLSSRR